MIYCPNCGTANRDGSRFCNDCGADLSDASGRRCPMCSALNPIESTVCNECGARLVPQTAPLTETETPRPEPVEGLPSPVERASAEQEAEPPDWLQQLRASSAEEVPAGERPAMPEPAKPVEEIPDWLKEIRPTEETKPREPPMAWEDEAEMRRETPSVAVAPYPSGEEEPDWLKRLRAASEGKPAPAEEPATPPEPMEVPSAREAPAPPQEEELGPDWLERLRQTMPEEAPPAEVAEAAPPVFEEAVVPPFPVEAEAEEEIPDWLQRLRPEPEGPPSVPVEAEAPPLAVEEEAEEVPDWLQELRPEPDLPPRPAEAEAPPLAEEEKELPDWLRELRPEPEPPSMPAEAKVPPLVMKEEVEAPPLAVEAELEEEVPDWLKGLGPTPELEGETLAFREEEEGEKPVAAPERLEEKIAEEMPPPIEKVPDRLKELGPTPEGEVPVFKEAEGVPPGEEAAEWLREPGPPELAAEEAAEVPLAVLGVEVPTDEVPDWLKELGPPVTAERPAVEEEAPLPPPLSVKEKVGPPVAVEEALEIEKLVQAEIPVWLQELRPREAEEGVAEVLAVIETVETTGLLAGIQGVLPVEPIVSGPHKAPPAPTAAVTVGPEQANLFREIIAQEPAPVTEVVAPRRARIWGEVLRRFIYLLIALAVIIPLFGEGDWFGEAELPSAAATDFYDAIQNLPLNSVVLLAFDYDPSTAAEMDRLAEPVLWHLMDRNVRLMAVSLLPTGPAVAGNLLDRIAGEHDGYQYGQNYVNLGYIPGQAAAPNELASDLRTIVPQDYRQQKSLGELPATQDINGIQDVSLIIEFAAQQRTLQWWIEQVGSQYQVEIMAAVSAAVEPTATPYHNSGQLVGLVSGLPSAARYEMKTNKWPSLAIASVDAQSVAHLAIVALIVLGSLASLVSARRK
ncbi:MAG: zinc-ribbon domain-containing protein [Anaerolineales bacterium]|nr:MAG: zinc-ribbon domain-containing protein [Anaerolineales bacterium]